MINYLAISVVPRAGVEPARVAPLVFETSASTDSAIWAASLSPVRGLKRCKDRKFWRNVQSNGRKICRMWPFFRFFGSFRLFYGREMEQLAVIFLT